MSVSYRDDQRTSADLERQEHNRRSSDRRHSAFEMMSVQQTGLNSIFESERLTEGGNQTQLLLERNRVLESIEGTSIIRKNLRIIDIAYRSESIPALVSDDSIRSRCVVDYDRNDKLEPRNKAEMRRTSAKTRLLTVGLVSRRRRMRAATFPVAAGASIPSFPSSIC